MKVEFEDNSHSLENNKGKWLKKLQAESWELELLVSGFSILLLVKFIDWISVVSDNISFTLNMDDSITSALFVFLVILRLASYALIINLVIHLIFRGFWVGIVGLGSVAPETDFNKLKYSNFFLKKLKTKIVKLEDLVISVDNICSLIFAFAFLVMFFLISIAMFFGVFALLTELAEFITGVTNGFLLQIMDIISVALLVGFLLGGILYLIDFLTLGLIKKSKRISKFYYPIYKFFGWITFSFFYRTIYYNLITRFSKIKIGLLIFFYLLLLVIVPGMSWNNHILL